MVLYFVRHGDAVQTTSLSDSDRPLSELGRLQAESVGKFLRSTNNQIERIFSSPLQRAIETATIVGKTLKVERIEQTEYLVPGTRKGQLFDLLNSNSLHSVLLTGHEPHLSQTVSLLLSEKESLPLEFKKCSLACLVASEPIRIGHALLQWLVTYEQMELLRR
jgi:phosphohistidine phosphatase